MKKLLTYALAACALGSLATSCSSDEPLAGGQDGNVTFTLQLPQELASRTFGDGLSSPDLTAVAYFHRTDPTATLQIADIKTAKFTTGSLTTTVSFDLANGQDYDIVFWAADNANCAYTLNNATATVSLTGTLTADQESQDAFFAAETLTTKGGAISKTVKLYRPFAQLNLGTSDLASAAVAGNANLGITGAYPNKVWTTVTADTYESFSLLDGKVIGTKASHTFPAVEAKPANEAFPVSGYDYLSMVYLLVNDKISEDVEFNFYDGQGGTKKHSLTVPATPLQRNYQTNIFGALLTTTAEYNVEIVPAFDGTNPWPVTTVNDPSQLAAAIAQGGNVVLNTPVPSIDLSNLQKPLTLQLNAKVDEVNLWQDNENSPMLTIVVGKDVDYPALAQPTHGTGSWGAPQYLENVTIKGDPTTSKPCPGYSLGTRLVVVNGDNRGWWILSAVKNVTFDGILFEGPNNTNAPAMLDMMNAVSGGDGGVMDNVTVKNCVFRNITKPAIYFQFTPANGKSYNANIGNITIEGNTVESFNGAASTVSAIYAQFINGKVVVRDNVLNGAPYNHIFVTACGETEITGNTVSHNAGKDAIKLDTFMGKEVTGNVTISDNTITNPAKNGIRLTGFVTNCTLTVTGNTITPGAATQTSSFYGINIENVTGNPLLIVKDNIKGSTDAQFANWWFGTPGTVTTNAGNQISTPYSN